MNKEFQGNIVALDDDRPEVRYQTCNECKGAGQIEIIEYDEDGEPFPAKETCLNCEGYGDIEIDMDDLKSKEL